MPEQPCDVIFSLPLFQARSQADNSFTEQNKHSFKTTKHTPRFTFTIVCVVSSLFNFLYLQKKTKNN